MEKPISKAHPLSTFKRCGDTDTESEDDFASWPQLIETCAVYKRNAMRK